MDKTRTPEPPDAPQDRPALDDAAKRALAEAEERRRARAAAATDGTLEIGGRNGPEPVRYGDWEVKGLATDF